MSLRISRVCLLFLKVFGCCNDCRLFVFSGFARENFAVLRRREKLRGNSPSRGSVFWCLILVFKRRRNKYYLDPSCGAIILT